MLDQSESIKAGFFTAVLLLFIGFFVVLLFLRQRHGKKYDERQIAAQNAAYRLAYFTLLIYFVAYGFLRTFRPGLLEGVVFWHVMMAGILLSLVVFAVICILRDAYFRASDSPMVTIGVFLAIGVIDLVSGLVSVLRGGGQWSTLMLGIAFLLISGTALVKRLADKRSSDPDEEP